MEVGVGYGSTRTVSRQRLDPLTCWGIVHPVADRRLRHQGKGISGCCKKSTNSSDCHSVCWLNTYRRPIRRKEEASGAKSGTITSSVSGLRMSIEERVNTPIQTSATFEMAHIVHRPCQGHHAESPADRQEGKRADLAGGDDTRITSALSLIGIRRDTADNSRKGEG